MPEWLLGTNSNKINQYYLFGVIKKLALTFNLKTV